MHGTNMKIEGYESTYSAHTLHEHSTITMYKKLHSF